MCVSVSANPSDLKIQIHQPFKFFMNEYWNGDLSLTLTKVTHLDYNSGLFQIQNIFLPDLTQSAFVA